MELLLSTFKRAPGGYRVAPFDIRSLMYHFEDHKQGGLNTGLRV